MSEPSLEYNLGSLGYQNSVQLSLLAYQDARAIFCLLFSNPKNKRLKPVYIQLTDALFARFYELLLEAEVQINKLLTSNKISALSLPTDDTHFRSNLGDVRYNSCILGVTVLVSKDATGCLQVFAVDTKSRADGFSVIFDDDEFTKLKKIFRETHQTIFEHKQQNAIHTDVPEARNQKFIRIGVNGRLSPLDVRNIQEAHLALKEIPLLKKELVLNKREVDEKIRQLRADYTHQRQQQGSKMRGGGWIGQIVRAYQTADTDNQRYTLAAQIKPLEGKKRYYESLISQLAYYAFELDKIMQGKYRSY